MRTPQNLLTDENLHALVDGQLDADTARAVRQALASDPAARAHVATLGSQRAALRSLHAEVLADALPPPLARAAMRLEQRRAHAMSLWRWGGIAASVLLAFAAGWLGHGGWDRAVAGELARAAPLQRFAHAATVAHAVYQPEARHPVEVPAAQQEHLVQWLSKRLARPLRVPDLHAAGYELVGGRLLPGDGGARAQFMYQSATGERVTLYVGAVDGASPAAAAQREAAFRIEQSGGVSAFYWVDQGFGYALAGALPREPLLDLATRVYRQLAPAS